MPTYQFKDTNTGELVEKTMKISELDEFKKNNPHLEVHISGSPGMSDPIRLGIRKPSSGFQDLLRSMKKANRRSTINDF